MTIEIIVILWLAWVMVGLAYASAVRAHNKDHRLLLKFWIAGLVFGPLILILLSTRLVRLIIAAQVDRVLNIRL